MPQSAAPNPLPLLAIMFVVFYLLVFRPQTKARKAQEEMLKNLKKHDEVVTVGGLFGTVVNVKPDAVTLRIDENVRVDVEKSAITRLVKSRGDGASASAEETRHA